MKQQILNCSNCKTINYAKEEAKKLNHVKIDTEHLLLALIHKGRVTKRILQELGVNLEKLEMKVKAMINKKSFASIEIKQPMEFTSAASQVLQCAEEEAQKVYSDYVYPEHILLGLIQEKNGIAAKVLSNFGVSSERVRKLLVLCPILKLSSKQLNLNYIDKAVRDLVYFFNKIPFFETSCSCSGHPDIPTKEWNDGYISLYVKREAGQIFNFLELIRARLDNTHGLELSKKAPPYFNRALRLYKLVDGEALYSSAIPILTTTFESLIQSFTTFDKLPLMWNILLKIAQEFISSPGLLPYNDQWISHNEVKTQKDGAEAFINLVQSVPHIQEIKIWDPSMGVVSQNGPNPYLLWEVTIVFLWDRFSIQWGWDLMDYLRTHFEKELKLLKAPNKPQVFYGNYFSIYPIVKRTNLQRTREEHLKIWKLIELVARDLLYGEAPGYSRESD